MYGVTILRMTFSLQKIVFGRKRDFLIFMSDHMTKSFHILPMRKNPTLQKVDVKKKLTNVLCALFNAMKFLQACNYKSVQGYF